MFPGPAADQRERCRLDPDGLANSRRPYPGIIVEVKPSAGDRYWIIPRVHLFVARVRNVLKTVRRLKWLTGEFSCHYAVAETVSVQTQLYPISIAPEDRTTEGASLILLVNSDILVSPGRVGLALLSYLLQACFDWRTVTKPATLEIATVKA